MTNLLTTILFEHPAWLTAIPGMMIALALLLWKKPRSFLLPGEQSESASRDAYYLPFLSLFRNRVVNDIPAGNRKQFITRYTSYVVFLSLLMVSMAGPYQQGRQLPEPPRHRDIVFMIDTSVSMSLKDYVAENKRIQRITMLKSVLGHFIDNLDGSRIGIIAFSEKAYTLSPLTTDYALLKYQLQRMEPAVMTGRTSNPSSAMLYTLTRFESYKEKPVLVMLTDIDRPNRQVDPRAAASYVSRQGYRLHTIGIGAGTSEAKDQDLSSLIYRPANFQLLEEVATAGNGEFFWAKNIASLNSALEKIKGKELLDIDITPRYLRQPLYTWFVLAALLWLSLWQLAPLFRKRS